MLAMRKLSECLTQRDQWVYFAEVYAWRIVRGYGSPDDKTCPVDPEGKWHNQSLIDDAVSRFRRTIAAERRAHEEAESRDPDVQAMNRRYARAKAWRDAGSHMPQPPPNPYRSLAAAEGVTATEASPTSHATPQPEMQLEGELAHAD